MVFHEHEKIFSIDVRTIIIKFQLVQRLKLKESIQENDLIRNARFTLVGNSLKGSQYILEEKFPFEKSPEDRLR